jgi:hydrogenase maturation protein HypF
MKITIPISCKPTLALGVDGAGSVAFANKKELVLTKPVGDLSYYNNFENYKKNILKLIEKQKPEIIVCDKHPDFISTKYAEELSKRYNTKLIKVQHHKSHVATVGVEHNLNEYVGIACDGLGFGDDEKLWGGEIFHYKNKKFERIGRLEEHIQLGGDSATIFPKKMLFGILSKFMNTNELLDYFEEDEVQIYMKQLKFGFNTFTTTSTGRVLDAVSTLLGICKKRTYDGQPAIELEKFAAKKFYNIKPMIQKEDEIFILNTSELFKFLISNIDKNKKMLAASAQMYIAKGLYLIAKMKKVPIVFSGGVAFNKMISNYMLDKGVLLNKKISCGDGGIPVGQIYIANL